jgi:hypothetical protein
MIRPFPRCRRLLAAAALAMLFAAIPRAANALLTFHVEGHMTEDSGSDLHIGDAFTAEYTFDPLSPDLGKGAPDWDAQFAAITNWKIMFASGYGFEYSGVGSSAGAIILANNNSEFPTGYDRYQATLLGVQSIGLPVPSGRSVGFIQFVFDDIEPTGNPDLISNLLLPVTPPSIALSTSAGGRVVFDGPQNGLDQPSLHVDSITLVPEPAITANLAILSLLIPAVRRRSRRRLTANELR